MIYYNFKLRYDMYQKLMQVKMLTELKLLAEDHNALGSVLYKKYLDE